MGPGSLAHRCRRPDHSRLCGVPPVIDGQQAVNNAATMALARDIAMKQALKHDKALEQRLRAWIRNVLGTGTATLHGPPPGHVSGACPPNRPPHPCGHTYITQTTEDPLDAQYSAQLADEATPFQAILKNGEILCRLINKLAPGSVKKVNVGTAIAFKQAVRPSAAAPRGGSDLGVGSPWRGYWLGARIGIARKTSATT